MKKKISIIISLILVLALVAGCQQKQDGDKKLSIGSKALTENAIVAEMYAQVLEDEGFIIERKFKLGTPVILQQAMEKEEVDLYPEYTGTALMTILKKEPVAQDDKVYRIVKTEYKHKYNFDWLDQAPLNNTHAIVVRRETADKYNLSILSDLSKVADEFVIGAKPEFIERADGLKGLQKVYGGFEFKDVKTYEPALRYKALTNKEIDATVAFTTDGQIKKNNLIVLEDDKQLWPPYHIAPVVRGGILEKYPEIQDRLNEVSVLLTDEAAQELNWKVEGEKEEIEDVAKEFLLKKDLLEK